MVQAAALLSQLWGSSLRQPTCVLLRRMTRSWLTEVSVQYRSQSSRSVAVVQPSCFCMLRTA